jgi:long-chain acyl-CoA synthetase
MFHLSRVLMRAASLFADRIAVEDGAVTLTYGALAARVAALAAGLARRGVNPGDRVALLDRNSFRTMELHFACAALGAVLVPLNVRLARPEIQRVLAQTEPVLVFAPASFAVSIDHGSGTVSWNDADPLRAPSANESLLAEPASLRELAAPATGLAQIFYTSGTNGEPKGVCLTHGNLVASALDSIVALEFNADDVWLHVAPMFHLVDAFAIWAITLVGARHVVRHFVAASFAGEIAAYGITKTSMPPTLIALAAEQAEDRDPRFASLKRVSYGGSPMPEAVHHRASRVMGADFVQAYGITETSGLVTQQLPGDYRADGDEAQRVRITSAGGPVLSIDLRIVGDAGEDVAQGTVGEILVAGPRVMAGYWRNPEATCAAITDGWYRTGDLGRRDAAGHLFIVGRKKDMIISGGENVYPNEVENALALHPAVLEVAVFGIPSVRWGEEVRAAIVFRDGSSADPDELIAFCRKRIGGYKIPKSFEFRSEPLPKTGPGKVAKNILRDPYWRSA